MPTTTVDIHTSAGPMKTEIATPSGGGKHPAAILCFDAGGLRPAMTEMAEHIASWGYVVAVPDLFHRVGDPFSLVPPGTPRDFHGFVQIFGNAELRNKFMSTFMASATNDDNLRVDATALLDWLDRSPDVRPGKAAVFGYCMGGNSAMRIAGILPDRIAAFASFHGGGLVTDQPTSPHKLVPSMKCESYLAFEEGHELDDTKKKLDEAFGATNLPHKIETYAGTKHGFAVSDHPTYVKEASERQYAALKELFSRTLK